VTGPERAGPRDIASLNRLFSSAFTERYRRDGMNGVRVPHLNPAVWRYAIANAGEGAMLWRDTRGDLAAFNLVHRSGREGWMGPLAVRTDRQGGGLGGSIVRAGVDWLRTGGATTIGLETMPRTIDNIGFYSRLGFRPGPLTVTLQAESRRTVGGGTERVGSLSLDARGPRLAACLALTDRVSPGSDYSRECDLTLQQELGDIHCAPDAEGGVAGFALWHAVALAESRRPDELRILKLVADTVDTAQRLVAAALDEAARRRLPHVTLRCQGSQRALYGALIDAGWQVQWTDLRMTLDGHAEAVPEGVLLSNWEI
jgi:GNAT superfamily N-acetyltransferase